MKSVIYNKARGNWLSAKVLSVFNHVESHEKGGYGSYDVVNLTTGEVESRNAAPPSTEVRMVSIAIPRSFVAGGYGELDYGSKITNKIIYDTSKPNQLLVYTEINDHGYHAPRNCTWYIKVEWLDRLGFKLKTIREFTARVAKLRNEKAPKTVTQINRYLRAIAIPAFKENHKDNIGQDIGTTWLSQNDLRKLRKMSSFSQFIITYNAMIMLNKSCI